MCIRDSINILPIKLGDFNKKLRYEIILVILSPTLQCLFIMVKNIILLLLLGICISSSAQKYKLVTTQWSKGKSAGNDYIKLLVDGTNHCSESGTGDSVANLGRTVVFDSNLDSLYIHGTDTSWGLGSGKFRFPDSPIWDSVSYGTQILICLLYTSDAADE